MIGRVVIAVPGRGEMLVKLEDDGTLHFSGLEMPSTARLIRDRFEDYKRNYGPEQGAFGVQFLRRTARIHATSAEIERKASEPAEGRYF